MEQIFIKVDNGEQSIDKDIRDSTYAERVLYYDSISKGQIVSILERVGGFKKEEVNRY